MKTKKVIFVRPLKAFRLLLEFEGNEYRLFDFQEVYKNTGGVFREILNDPDLFQTVKLDGTGTICWDNDVDIAVEYLYNMSTNVSELNSVV